MQNVTMQLNYIANASVPSSSGRTLAVIDPSDGQPFDEIQRSNADDIDAAVHAARHGSPLDATLTLYDNDRRVVAQSDDLPGSRDPAVRAILPHDGAYFLAVADAHDSGGPWHAYRLVVR